TDDNPMLRWYRALLDLRHKYVIPNERTCRAELVGSTIRMHVPAENPKLLVVATFPSPKVRGIEKPHGEELLTSREDGYSVSVYRVDKTSKWPVRSTRSRAGIPS